MGGGGEGGGRGKHACFYTNDPETSSIFSNNPLVSFRHSKNIRETLVHSNLHQESSPLSGTFPCGVAQCKTCKFVDSSTVISAPKFSYNIKHNFTCTSTHLIYCISCSRRGMLYIGETGRQLRTRFGEHRRAVSANDANQPVARHFNSGSHCISDMIIRALPFLVATIAAKDRKCVSFPNLEPCTLLVLTSVFPSFSVTCLCLTCSDIGRSNATFVFNIYCLVSPLHAFSHNAYF